MNKLIEASAGTGKTQALANHLIELLKSGINPEEIVALTFSRAAAGEIFERFVRLLAERREIAHLRKVLAAQHLSQIGTLDSFLMRIVRAFPEELGLVGELEIMSEGEAASQEARLASHLLHRTDPKLKKNFAAAFSLAMNQEDVRSFVDSYQDFIDIWHTRVAAMPQEDAWGIERTIWPTEKPRFEKITVELLDEAATRVEQLLGAQHEKWNDFAKWVRGFRGTFGKPTGFTKNLLADENALKAELISFSFSRRQYALTREETIAVQNALQAVFGFALRQKLELARGIYRLMSAFETEYAREIRRQGHLVFEDVPRLLKALSEENRLALEFRMDSKIRAWALDEFQDTSREQWAALRNLLDEAKQSGDEKSVFIVGDRKQAIYGWRNGDVSIFTGEKKSGCYALDELNKTYRSSAAIVEAVNRVFTKGRILTDFPTWEAPTHCAANPDQKGFVRVMTARDRFKEDFVEPVLVAAKTIPRGVSAAILVRNNAFGELLATELKAQGLKNVVWEGESKILDTPALSGFLDLFQLADHPGDALTYRHFAMTPLARAMYPDGLPSAAELSNAIAREMTTEGVVRTLRKLRARLPEDPAIAWSAFTEERFTDLLRAAAEFELSTKAGSRLADFPSFAAREKKRTVAEPNQIKILTIHRSKGLGFDFVILPLYEHEAINKEPKGPLIGPNWILPEPDPKVARAVGGLEAAYRLRKDRSEQEELCAYYVAMTRAKQGMTIICQPAPKQETASIRFSDLVRAAGLDDLANTDVRLTPSKETEAASEDAPAVPRPPAVRASRTTYKRRLPSRSFSTGTSAATLFTTANARVAAMERGTQAHAAMEQIEFSAELPRPDGFVELWREQAFEVFHEGEWISGRFDRVTFFRTSEGLSAEIIDFKTSIEHPERYDAQLAAYRRAVHALTGIPLARISARLMKIDPLG